MKLFKKATAAIALVTLVSGIFSTGVSAYSTAQLEAANDLAAKGIINTKADANGYALDQNVLRQEIAAVARGVAGLSKKTTCDGTFNDVTATTPNTWACYSVEALSDAGLIALNDNFRPEANISKAEAVGMMVKAAYGDEYAFDSSKGSSWQAQVVEFAVGKGILSNFTNYDTAATRGFVFEVGSSALSSEDSDEDDLTDLIDDLLGDNDEDTDTDTDTDTDEDTDTVVSGDNVLEVTLSADTPDAATIPGAIDGLPVAKFDFTAGSEDVTVTSLTVKRTGLSDEDTIDALAVFTDEGRASKSKNDSQENDTQALLTLSSGGVVIKAGETREITIVADIASSSKANGDEFAIELINVEASSNVEGVDDLVANTMKVGGVDAATLVIRTDGSVSDVKVGDNDAEIFKFKIDGDTDEDVVLKKITFKGEGSVDEEDELANYKLMFDDEEVATTASANGKYLTFDLGEGITIKEDKTEKFIVTADVVSGVTEDIAFIIDKTLDVSAEGTKYGFGASVNINEVDSTTSPELGSLSIKIDAGELTLSDIDAPSDKIRADKKNVELGSIKVTNVSGAALELQKFTIDATFTSTNTSYDEGSEIFENFEVEIGSTTYELDLSGSGTYSDTDLDVVIPEGTTNIIIKADTKENVPADVEVDLEIKNITTTGFYVVETEEDEPVTDITPSSLSFKKLSFISAGATVAGVPLADVTVVRGANKIVANQFEVEAEEASAIEVDEVVVDLDVLASKTSTTDLISTTTGANLYVSEVALYKGSVSDANLLDTVSGTKISSSGEATFDGFKVNIAADQEETFIVTVTIVDGSDAEGKFIKIDLDSGKISAEDDDSDDVTVTGSSAADKIIEVTAQGSITITADAGNDANEDPKTILAGESEIVYSADVQAINEEVDVEKVIFTYTGGALKNPVETASLYLDGTLVATNSNSDITENTTTGTIIFDNLSKFIVPEENVEFELKVNTANIGYEKVGTAVSGISINKVEFEEAEGVDSGKPVTVSPLTITKSNTFDVVPALVTPSVYTSLNSSTIPQIKITADAGNNTKSDSNTTPDVEIQKIVFSTLGTTDTNSGITYQLVNVDDTSKALNGVYNETNNTLTFDFAEAAFTGANLDRISDGSSERYKIVITNAEVDTDSITLTLLEDGITYKVDTTSGIKTNLTSEIDFGSRTY